MFFSEEAESGGMEIDDRTLLELWRRWASMYKIVVMTVWQLSFLFRKRGLRDFNENKVSLKKSGVGF